MNTPIIVLKKYVYDKYVYIYIYIYFSLLLLNIFKIYINIYILLLNYDYPVIFNYEISPSFNAFSLKCILTISIVTPSLFCLVFTCYIIFNCHFFTFQYPLQNPLIIALWSSYKK